MLLGLDPVLSPDLLHALVAMGHGDRLARQLSYHA
jgi:L-fucose mutarotase